MFEGQRARDMLTELQRLTEANVKILGEEADLYTQVGGQGPATPEGVALLSARLQLAQLTTTVVRMGEIIAEMLIDQIDARDLGVE